jgi:hypothetical protein
MKGANGKACHGLSLLNIRPIRLNNAAVVKAIVMAA